MLKISELCFVTNGAALQPYDDINILNVTTDSRTTKPDSAFVALRGEKFDGHDFCQDAIKNGAKVIVIEKFIVPPPDNVVQVKVNDTLTAYQDIASFYRSKFDIPVIAVTGSTGKTTPKELIYAALERQMPVLKSHANFNNEIGLPATLLNLESKYKAAVVEMGMRGIGQIQQLAQIARPTIGVITNVNQTHIEVLKTMENITIAKQELVQELTEHDFAILNCDDDNVLKMSEHTKAKVVFYGFNDKADITATDIEYLEEGTEFKCVDKEKKISYHVFIPLLGKHNVYNTLAAIAVAKLLNVDVGKMLEGLKNMKVSKMRQEIIKISGITFIDDTYNASPASMQASLELLEKIQGNRKIAVFGDMLELGEYADSEHEKLGELVAKYKTDILLTVGDKSFFACQKAFENGVKADHFKKNEVAAYTLLPLLKKGDVVLVKGSRGMHMEVFLQTLQEKMLEEEPIKTKEV